MSKENSLVLGLAWVPLIGMILIRRRAGALGSAAACFWAHAALPRSSRAAATAIIKPDDRQNFLAAMHREPLLVRIRPSHVLVSDPNSRLCHSVGDHIMRGRDV